MNKWFLIVDVDNCINCNNCTLATKDEYVGNDFAGYAAAQPPEGQEWITIDRHVRGSGSMVDVTYVPRMCNHCDNAPCIEKGAGAINKRADGIVIIDPVKAKGRKDLIAACPYGAITWNEQAQLPQHWIFDAHLLDAGWKEPRCVQVCPTGALRSMKTTDAAMRALVAQDNLAELRPELGTKPRVFYRNLQRVRDGFLGGNVFSRNTKGQTDNIAGATVELTLAGSATAVKTVTDHYGDFKFDGLATNGGRFSVRIAHRDFGRAQATGTLSASLNLGAVELKLNTTSTPQGASQVGAGA